MRPDADALFAFAGKKKKVPFDFVLDELEAVGPWTRPFFGCTGVYVDDKIMFVLRQKGDQDDGIWVGTTSEHHASLRREMPALRSIAIFGKGETGWQVIPADADDFEEEALHACALVRAGDARIGKVPKRRAAKRPAEAKRPPAPAAPKRSKAKKGARG